jgi:hypothetical protein
MNKSDLSLSALPFVSAVCHIAAQAGTLPYLVSLYCCQDYPAQRREFIILDTSADSQLGLIEMLTDGQQEALNIRYVHAPHFLTSDEIINKIKELSSGELIVELCDDMPYPQDYLRTKVDQRQATSKPQYSIGFYMETAFHYQIYRPIFNHLLDRGYSCHLVIADFVPPALVQEMQTLLGEINEPRLRACAYSKVHASKQAFDCLVSPYYTPALNNLAPIHIRTIYGLAKEQWNHAWWNAFYHQILCYSHYSQQALNINGNAVMVGNPRFDEWHNNPGDTTGFEELKLDPKKPTLLYAPTFGALSSIPHWAKWLERLSRDFNVITKLHHGTLYRPEEAPSLAIARRHLKKRIGNHALTFPALRQADYVLTDNSGFIFDAIHAGKRTILLNWENMESLLEDQQTYSSPYSADQKIRSVLPVAHNIEELRALLNAEEKWQQLEPQLSEIRDRYCDAWQDGKAGERAAQAIITAITNPAAPEENALLHSLRQMLFSRFIEE